MERKKLFVAVDLPQEVIEQIVEIQKRLQGQNLFTGRLTHVEHLHLTLKFIGEVDELMHQRVQQALEKIAFPKMQASLGRLGSFSVKGSTNIVWIAIEGEELAQLAHAVNDVLDVIVPHEKREFVSHVTIARVKSVPDESLLREFLEQTPIPKFTFDVTEFVLKDSVLSDAGPYYKVLETYLLV